jgi:hypothetical protein
MVQKMLLFFYQHLCRNFKPYFRLQLLHQAPYSDGLLPNGVAIKNLKNYKRKICLSLVPEMFGEIASKLTD